MNLSRSTFMLAVGLFPLSAIATQYCGSLTNSFGPFDNRKSTTEYVHETFLVESTHFLPEIENLIAGHSGYLGDDLDYTLRAFPNHHRALASIAKLALREKSAKDPHMRYSFLCYFERAMRFAPDDDGVYMVYGTYLFKRGDVAGAKQQFMQALALNADNVPANYNLGLIYLREGSFDKAREYAKKAYAADYPVQGLKNGLVAAGKWDAR